MDKKAFTLIELLVVVLIVGILAAIALPQYQRAVDLSRTKGTFPVIRAIVEAEKAFYMENGRYTKDFEELSIDFPVKSYKNGSLTLADGSVYSIGDNGTYWHVFAYPFGLNNMFIYWAIPRDWWLCYPQGARGKNVCKALGCDDVEGSYCRFYLR